MGADHPVSWCKDYQGGRSFYTGLGNTVASFNAGLTTHLKGAINWAAGQSDPVYSDCGATVLKNYQQVKVSGPPNLSEPIGFDQFPDGRVIQTDRRGGVHLHDPVSGHVDDDRQHPGLHRQRGRPLRAGRRQQLRHQPLGLPLLLPAHREGREAVGRQHRHPDDADQRGAEHGRELQRVGSLRRVLPAVAVQVRRRRPRQSRRTWTWTRRRRSCGSRTTAAPAVTSPATSTSTSTTTSGSSPATTARPAAATPAASPRSTTPGRTSRRRCASTTPPAARSR